MSRPRPLPSVSDPFFDELLALIDEYVAKACPCRFPRFRAIAKRDTSGVAGGAFRSDEQLMLIRAFEQKVPLVNKQALEGWAGPMTDGTYEAACGVCGSFLARYANEFASGAWVDMLAIRKPKGLEDIGARAEQGRI